MPFHSFLGNSSLIKKAFTLLPFYHFFIISDHSSFSIEIRAKCRFHHLGPPDADGQEAMMLMMLIRTIVHPVDDVNVDDVDGVDEDYCTPDNLSMEDRLTNTIEITKRMSDAVE